jgi:hypothetical protein
MIDRDIAVVLKLARGTAERKYADRWAGLLAAGVSPCAVDALNTHFWRR